MSERKNNVDLTQKQVKANISQYLADNMDTIRLLTEGVGIDKEGAYQELRDWALRGVDKFEGNGLSKKNAHRFRTTVQAFDGTNIYGRDNRYQGKPDSYKVQELARYLCNYMLNGGGMGMNRFDRSSRR